MCSDHFFDVHLHDCLMLVQPVCRLLLALLPFNLQCFELKSILRTEIFFIISLDIVRIYKNAIIRQEDDDKFEIFFQLIRCVTIAIFELDRHLADSDVAISPDEISEKMSPEEIGIVRLLSDLLAGMLNAFLLPVYTVKQVRYNANYHKFST